MTEETRKWVRSIRAVEREFQRLVDALQVIVDVDRRIFETATALDDLLDEVLKGTCKLTGARFAQILLRRGHELRVVHSTDPAHHGAIFRIDGCVCGIAIETDAPVISGDVQKDFGSRYRAMLGNDSAEMRSEVVIPIKSPPPHSVIMGVLNVEWPHPDAFDPGDTDIVVQFARQAGAAIHSARSREALQLTLDLTKSFRAAEPQKELRSILTQLTGFFSQIVELQFLLHECKAGSLIVEYSTVPSTEGVRVLVENSFCGLVVRERRSLLSNDVQVDYAAYFQDTVGGTRSELAVPIFDSDETVIGVLNVESSVTGAFTEHDLYLVEVLAGAGIWQRHREMRRTRAVAHMAAIGDVAANVIHFLRNALIPIRAQSNRILALAPPDSASDDFKRELSAFRVLLEDVTNRMVSLDEKYKNALRGNVPTDINRVVEETRAMITRPEITFILDLDRDIPMLQLPPSISDVLWNLVSNASCAIPESRPGNIAIRTRLTIGRHTQKPEALEIQVSDDGTGINRAKLETIFELGQGDRHGYGLWWVKAFVERCEGMIRVKSESGQGSQFQLSFPLTADGAVRATQNAGDYQ